MTPTQHEKIDRLFHAALAVAPDQRDIWLAQACEGDDELHREVKSLLALSEEAETFIKVPLFNDAREASAERQDQTITRKTKYCPQCQRQYQATERLCPQDGSFLSLQDPYKLVGRTLADKYRLDALVGMGGMGAVYYCYHTGINRRVAFKILLPHLALQSERVLEMFETEAKTSGQLSHENIADVKDAGRTSEGIAYLVMEWLDGRTLEQEIADSGPLQLGRIVNILRQIAAALDTAHAQRIIHRDLKPSNVMLIKRANGSDHVKVLDFGIAKILDNTAGTTVSQVMGTPHYASPEQLEPGKRINTSSDIYSLGVMLYQMLTRKLPFDAPAIRELIQMQLSAPSPSVREQRPDAPAPVEQLVHRMLAKDPDHRPARAGEVARLFESAVRASAGLQAERAEVAVSDAPIVTMRQNAHPTAKGRAAISEPTASPPTDALKARPEKVGVFKLVGAMLTALVIAATGIYFCLNRQPVLTEKNTILLTDFENKTGDPVFDGVLEHGLAVQLEQSPFMKIFSEDRVRETLRYMGRSPDEDVTPVIGREICQRQGIKAMLTGSIASLGRNYVIGLEAVNGQSGEKLALEQGEADGKEQVLRTLGQMAARLREKLGEAISSVQKFNAPFYMATTPSFEAFKSYSIGRQQQNKDKNPQAISAYKRAIELDPNFARAYSALSLLYFIGGERELAAEFATKAFELRERTSEFEKMDISIRYYQYVTGEIDRVIEVAEQLKQSYQNDFAPHNVLSTTYNRIGQFEKACEEAREALRLDPTFAPGYASLADSLINLSRFEEAKEVIQRAIAQHCDRPILHQFLYDIAFIQGDTSAMQKQID